MCGVEPFLFGKRAGLRGRDGKEYDMLETERLLLRKWTEEDADSLFEYAKDPEVGPIAGWPPHRSREESLDVIRNVLNGRECYAICRKGKSKSNRCD